MSKPAPKKTAPKAAARRPAPAHKASPARPSAKPARAKPSGAKPASKSAPARPASRKAAIPPPAAKKAASAQRPTTTGKATASRASGVKASGVKRPAPAAAKPAKAPAKAAPAKKAVAARAPKPEAAPAKAAPAKVSEMAKVAVPVPTRAPGAPLAVPPGVVPRKGRGTSKYYVAPVQAPLPAPTSRFADRFAPPRPPTRHMTKPENDLPRQQHKPDPKLANAWKAKAGRDLTDAELQAMPDSEYMNEKQLEFFRTRLQALKDDLLSNAGETTEHLREDTSIVPDPADRATIEEEHALELRTRDRERKLLKKISQSLARLESGEYGFCDETGEPIGLGRLIARPTATLSLEAQQRRELKQKMFGD